MKHFTINEFEKSAKACQLGIDNTIPSLQKKNIEKLVNLVLDPLREALEVPIIISSGYRCPRLNKAVGGVPDSQHVEGLAADITFQKRDTYCYWAYCLLKSSNHPYRQYINQCIYYEKKGFIHVSISENDKPKGQFWIQA